MTQQAQKTEAAGVDVTAVWHDEKWTVPPQSQWSWDVLEAIDDQRYTIALRALLGPQQYAKFKTLKPSINDGGDLLSAIAEAAGLGDTGE